MLEHVVMLQRRDDYTARSSSRKRIQATIGTVQPGRSMREAIALTASRPIAPAAAEPLADLET